MIPTMSPVTDRDRFPWPAPFAATSILSYALLVLSPDVDATWLAAAVVVNAAILSSMWLGPWHRVSLIVQAAPVLGYFAFIALLREATGEGSGYGPLVLLPIVWLGLYGTWPEIVVGSLSVGATFLVPAAVHDTLSGSVWRASILFGSLSLVLGFTLMQQVKAHAASDRRLRKLQAIDLNNSVVQQLTRAQFALDLGDTDQARVAISTATDSARQMVTAIVHSTGRQFGPGDFRRSDD